MDDWLLRTHEFTTIDYDDDDDSAIIGGGRGDWTTSLTGGDAFSFRAVRADRPFINVAAPETQRMRVDLPVRLQEHTVLEIETDGTVAMFSARELREILEWARASRPTRATPIDPAERPGGDGEV